MLKLNFKTLIERAFENIVGKGENAGYQHFRLFTQSFLLYIQPHNKDFNIAQINPFPNKPWFLRVCSISLLKTLWEKEKLLVMSNFSFSHSVFQSFGKLFIIFIKYEIVVCKLFQVGKV